jgi:NADPH2:quinone reductase
MRVAMCTEHGPPAGVQVIEVAVPPLAAGQVRVRVGAASINYPDVLVIADRYQLKVPVPFVPGSEYAGVVTEVARGVSAVAVGDVVASTSLFGAFAEEVAVAAAAVWPVPDGVDQATAAAFGVAHRTSYHVLRSVACLQPGEELVVLGAGGGVGLAAVQLGAVMGATVTAVASSQEKLDVAASYGATHLIDHRQGDLRGALRAAVPGGVDVVVDPVGGDLAAPAFRSLGWGGRFVTVGFASGTIPCLPLNLVLLKGASVLGFEFLSFATHRPDEKDRNEAELVDLLATARVVPHIGATFDLDQVVEALQFVADGRAVGKVVIQIGPT